MTWGERIFQANVILVMIGIVSTFYIAKPELRKFVLEIIPLKMAWYGVAFGFGVPAFCAGVYLLLLQRGKIFTMIADSLRSIFRKPAEAKKESGIIDILPEPRQLEYDRSGAMYARQVPVAMARIGLTQDQPVKVIGVTDGPAAARVTILLPPGLRLSQVENATKDLRAAIGAPSLQVQAGQVANSANLIITHRRKQPVVLKQIVSTPEYQKLLREGGLPVPVGVNEVGEPILTDLTKIAHVLVAGATGAGKSWWLNQLLVSWLMFLGPDRLRLALIDPKQVELSDYNGFPHVLEIATTVEDAVNLLDTLTQEMDRRYSVFRDAGVKNIAGYRRKTGKNMPYIGCVVDELADLMVQAKKEVEPLLQRLTQLARASGIHLVVATQRPSVDVITGVIKANLPSRVVFRLAKNHDYMTVLDDDPKVTLTGKGDGLAMIEGNFGLVRFQGVGVGLDDEDTERVLERLKQYWQKQGVQPAPVPAFEGGYVEREKTAEIPAQDKPEREARPPEQDPETRVRVYVARLADSTTEVELYLPPAAEIAQELKMSRATVNEVLGKLEREGWVSPPSSAGRGARRSVLLHPDAAFEWLHENGFAE